MTDHSRIRVLIVDDHVVVRSGLASILLAFDDPEMVGEAPGGQAALDLCAASRPDVVLMDLVMPEMDGATATRAIRQVRPHTQVIALTSFHEGELVTEALRAGAIGYLLKNVSADELAGAIRAAHAGQPTLAPEAAHVLIEHTIRPPAPPVGSDLSSREREVLALMVRGLSNPEIAAQLVVGRATIIFHVSLPWLLAEPPPRMKWGVFHSSNILAKPGASSRTEAVALALQQQLV